eukprot:scaffold2045_cov404-Prasinococcus_capsulatus_cf.AAC.70
MDYDGLGQSALFDEYIEASAELQRVEVLDLSREEKIAFFVNIYNAMVVHATATLGAPDNLIQRLGFFSSITYNIGGQAYSCDDIEHGVLRANAVSPAAIATLLGYPRLAPRTFGIRDPRRLVTVYPMDPRIHFALVCGAKSCPPIRVYEATSLETSLQGAAQAFCESEVSIDEVTKTVTLSKIFDWYGSDFAEDRLDRLRMIQAYAAGTTTGDHLRSMLDTSHAEDVRISYAPYDWGVNSKQS